MPSSAAALGYLEHVLRAMIARPGLWGQGEALELQALLVLELRDVLLGAPPARVKEAYLRFLRAQYPDIGAQPLWRYLGANGRDNELPAALGRFVAGFAGDGLVPDVGRRRSPSQVRRLTPVRAAHNVRVLLATRDPRLLVTATDEAERFLGQPVGKRDRYGMALAADECSNQALRSRPSRTEADA